MNDINQGNSQGEDSEVKKLSSASSSEEQGGNDEGVDFKKRYSDSSREAQEQKSRADKLAKEVEDLRKWQEQAVPIIQVVNSDERIKRILEGDSDETITDSEGKPLTKEDVISLLNEQENFKIVKQTTESFMGRMKIEDTQEKDLLIEHAKRLDTAINPRTQKPYTLPEALATAYTIIHPEHREEQIKLATMFESEKRLSASEAQVASGDGSAANTDDLSEEELRVIKKLGISPERYAAQKASL